MAVAVGTVITGLAGWPGRSPTPAPTERSVHVATLKARGGVRAKAAKPRLRFDRVVTRLIERLQATLSETVPDGTSVVLTVTALIRLPSAQNHCRALEDKIYALLAYGSPRRDQKATIHGNRVHLRFFATRDDISEIKLTSLFA